MFTSFSIFEKLMRVDYNEYAKRVTKVYKSAPSYDEKAIIHWRELNKSNHLLFKRMTSKIKVTFVDYEPYETQVEMKNKVQDTGEILISNLHNTHPYFSKEDNLIFRAVHDYIVHVQNDTPFGLKGELRAANYHMRIVPELAKPALFTEIVGQVCYAITEGDFPEQKVAVLRGFDYNNIGRIIDADEQQASV